MDQTIHPGLRVADAENGTYLTHPTPARQDALVPELRSRLDPILNVPRSRKELSWQLGAGGWKRSRLRLSLACGLVGRRFEHPHKNPTIYKSIDPTMIQFSPNALCFGEEFPASGAPCLVQIEGDGLTITYEPTVSTSPSERVLFTGLAVSAGGLDHDHLVLKWGEGAQARTLYLKHPDLIRVFREAAPDHLSQPFEQAAERVRQVRHRHRVMWGTVAGSIMAVALGLWFGADLLVEMAVSRIPVEWEQKLGEAAYKDFLSHQDVMKEGPAVKAVEEMTQRLAEQIPNNPYKFQVTVVKSDVINAFALPGGYVVVFTGLMKKADSGEEVAGVLGHELNHVLQRHGMERIVKNLGVMAVVAIIVGDQQGLIGLMRRVGVELLTLKFDRAQETEADLTGLQLVYRAKIDPKGMITFFQKLSEKDEGRVEWLSTHPMSSARADRLKAELAALPKRASEPFTFEWRTVQDVLGVQPVPVP